MKYDEHIKNCQEMLTLASDSLHCVKDRLSLLGDIKDNPEPREWRLWDMVKSNIHGAYIRLPKFQPDKWYPLTGCGFELSDSDVKDWTYLGNLADLLTQGDVLVAMTEDKARQIVSCRWSQWSEMVELAALIKVALAARKETT